MTSQTETQLQFIEIIKEDLAGQQQIIDTQNKLLDLLYLGIDEETRKKVIIDLELAKITMITSKKKLERILRDAEKHPSYDERSN